MGAKRVIKIPKTYLLIDWKNEEALDFENEQDTLSFIAQELDCYDDGMINLQDYADDRFYLYKGSFIKTPIHVKRETMMTISFEKLEKDNG